MSMIAPVVHSPIAVTCLVTVPTHTFSCHSDLSLQSVSSVSTSSPSSTVVTTPFLVSQIHHIPGPNLLFLLNTNNNSFLVYTTDLKLSFRGDLLTFSDSVLPVTPVSVATSNYFLILPLQSSSILLLNFTEQGPPTSHISPPLPSPPSSLHFFPSPLSAQSSSSFLVLSHCPPPPPKHFPPLPPTSDVPPPPPSSLHTHVLTLTSSSALTLAPGPYSLPAIPPSANILSHPNSPNIYAVTPLSIRIFTPSLPLPPPLNLPLPSTPSPHFATLSPTHLLLLSPTTLTVLPFATPTSPLHATLAAPLLPNNEHCLSAQASAVTIGTNNDAVASTIQSLLNPPSPAAGTPTLETLASPTSLSTAIFPTPTSLLTICSSPTTAPLLQHHLTNICSPSPALTLLNAGDIGLPAAFHRPPLALVISPTTTAILFTSSTETLIMKYEYDGLDLALEPLETLTHGTISLHAELPLATSNSTVVTRAGAVSNGASTHNISPPTPLTHAAIAEPYAICATQSSLHLVVDANSSHLIAGNLASEISTCTVALHAGKIIIGCVLWNDPAYHLFVVDPKDPATPPQALIRSLPETTPPIRNITLLSTGSSLTLVAGCGDGSVGVSPPIDLSVASAASALSLTTVGRTPPTLNLVALPPATRGDPALSYYDRILHAVQGGVAVVASCPTSNEENQRAPAAALVTSTDAGVIAVRQIAAHDTLTDEDLDLPTPATPFGCSALSFLPATSTGDDTFQCCYLSTAGHLIISVLKPRVSHTDSRGFVSGGEDRGKIVGGGCVGKWFCTSVQEGDGASYIVLYDTALRTMVWKSKMIARPRIITALCAAPGVDGRECFAVASVDFEEIEEVVATVDFMEVVEDVGKDLRMRPVGSIDVDGGCFCMARAGAGYLAIGADEEIVLVRWLKSGERRHPGTVGLGGLSVVSRVRTPSRCAVTAIAAGEGEGGAGTFTVAIAELLHSVVVYRFSEEDESLALVAMHDESFLITSMALVGGSRLYCINQSTDAVVALELEACTGADREGAKKQEEKRELLQNRLPAAFVRNNGGDTSHSLRGVGEVRAVFMEADVTAAMLVVGGSEVYAVSLRGDVAKVIAN